MSLKITLRHAAKRLIWQSFSWKQRHFRVGRHDIVLPPYHLLDLYVRLFPTYNQPISTISSVLSDCQPGFAAADIGANIGDTAAYICLTQDIPVLCIEGNPQYFNVLSANCSSLGKHIEMEKSYVGCGTEVMDCSLVQDHGGTTTLLPAFKKKVDQQNLQKLSNQNSLFLPLQQILERHPCFTNIKLLKTDTDGYDFAILKGSIDVLERCQPVLFFEYDPSFSTDSEESLQCIKTLLGLGYCYFLAFNNLGVASHVLKDLSDFARTNRYLKDCRCYGEYPVFYDICAVHQTDQDIYQAITARV